MRTSQRWCCLLHHDRIVRKNVENSTWKKGTWAMFWDLPRTYTSIASSKNSTDAVRKIRTFSQLSKRCYFPRQLKTIQGGGSASSAPIATSMWSTGVRSTVDHWERSCYSRCSLGHLENIFVPDLNNPDVSLNAFQVWDKFETNCTKTQKTVVLLNRQ